MSLKGLECPVSKLVHGDTRQRPTTDHDELRREVAERRQKQVTEGRAELGASGPVGQRQVEDSSASRA